MNELQGALLRRERAGEHLPELQRLVGEIIQLCENGVLAHVDLETEEVRPAPWIVDPMRNRASVLVGEMAYNLRAALDYLVYVLAENDSGSSQSGTQFPIEDSQQGFTAHRSTRLKGVSDEHAAIIRQFQPYRGCEWTRILRDLSNPDKHRELVSVDVDFTLKRLITMHEVDVTGSAEDGAQVGSADDADMTVYLKGPALVTLPDGLPVVETLEELNRQATVLLFLFSYEFPSG